MTLSEFAMAIFALICLAALGQHMEPGYAKEATFSPRPMPTTCEGADQCEALANVQAFVGASNGR